MSFLFFLETWSATAKPKPVYKPTETATLFTKQQQQQQYQQHKQPLKEQQAPYTREKYSNEGLWLSWSYLWNYPELERLNNYFHNHGTESVSFEQGKAF